MTIKYLRLALVLVLVSAAFAPNVVQAATHSVGTNILANGTVYAISVEGKKTVRRPYTSAGAFLSYSFNSWAGLQTANSEDLMLPEGSFIPPRDGTIMCSDRVPDKGTCYLVTEGEKAGFTAEYIFLALNYSYTWALYGDVSFLDSALNISTINEAHRPGVLLNMNNELYLSTVDGLKKATEANLKSWGYWNEDAIAANDNDKLIAKNGNLPVRTASDFRPEYDDYDDDIEIVTKLPKAIAGQPYSVLLKATGGTAPYRWSPVSTNYPSACCILGINGADYGDTFYFNDQSSDYVVTDHKGTFEWVVKVTDIFGKSTEETLELVIE